ncbi:hypothetical protein D7Y21_02420 [Corallococcus sp. AB045]|nr:hypothetical protein D7Y21_02420 [Corallococcus sp. AB045]
MPWRRGASPQGGSATCPTGLSARSTSEGLAHTRGGQGPEHGAKVIELREVFGLHLNTRR